jgi:hypothetical protein
MPDAANQTSKTPERLSAQSLLVVLKLRFKLIECSFYSYMMQELG